MNSLFMSANSNPLCRALSALCLTVLCVGSAACSGGANEPSDALTLERAIIRERAAGLWLESRRKDSLDVLKPLIEVESPEYIDLLNVGILEFARAGEYSSDQRRSQEYTEAAVSLFERASQLRPDEPAPYYNLGVLKRGEGDLEQAELDLQRAHELDPTDLHTHLHYANVLEDLDKFEEAEPHYREILKAGLDEGGGLYLSALYRLGQMLSMDGEPEGQAMVNEKFRLENTGVKVLSYEARRIGTYGKITWPRVEGADVPPPSSALGFADSAPAILELMAGMVGLSAWTMEENWKRIDVEREEGQGNDADAEFAPTQAPIATEVGVPDVAGWGPNGLVIALHQSDGSYEPHTLSTEPIRFARAFDFDEDGDLDVLAVTDAGVHIYKTEGIDGDLSWVPLESVLPEIPGIPTDIQPVDFDHEGDVDLLFVGPFGARLWRNDGFSVTEQREREIAAEKKKDAARRKAEAFGEEVPAEDSTAAVAMMGRWVDVSAEAKLPTGAGFDWCLIEDFDTDQDVDLLMGGGQGIYFADNLRGGVFADNTDALRPAAHLLGNEPIVADLNGDAWPDLWIAGSDQSHLYFRLPSGKYVSAATSGGPSERVSNIGSVDLNGDGYLDATWTRESGGAGYALSVGAGSKAPDAVSLFDGALATVWDDFDGDGAIDAISSYADRAEFVAGVREANLNTIRLALFAKERDNRRGLGAVVELRAGPIYRRVYWTGEPITLGMGSQTNADILRVTWPRGVEQHDFDIASGSRWSMYRLNRIEGSCPFLYTWNGETYEFITDVLGITPLGLPMAPGMMVPPDHDEYVLVRGEQMKPRIDEDGKAWFDMQFTEELREVTYLDRLRLEVVDHPEGTEIFPNERFSFPPFPEAHTHVMRDPLVPLKATDHRGEDWTSQVASIDGDYAIPFESYRGLLTGLAKPHTLELSFDPEQLADAELLRLVCTGWFLWSDASINMAAARTPGVDFIPPILQVPDASVEGGWRNVGPPVGFPAGKRKTMVLDVTDFIDRDDPRIRIFGTLCLYWDAIRLATDNDDEPLVVTHVEPSSAKLWQRGFSRSSHPLPGHMLEWFDWDELDEPRWNQHPGNYTKLGEVLPLMTAIDDMYAIMGAGDALHARFSADNLPELKDGWRRDYLVFLDGWAKDRDPNTLEALYVEPLPFHGMSGYPYRADESFPDTEEHREWRREWNTRPSRRWIEELAPGRTVDVSVW